MSTSREEQHVKVVLNAIASTRRLLGLDQPTYGGTPVLTKAQAQAAFAKIKAQLDETGAERAILQEPGVQCNGWCVTLEETNIDFWPGHITDTIGDALQRSGVFAEPVTHCHLGLYPA
jgi:hypothetical protein